MNIQDAINFLIQYLRDSGFEGDIENGTALYDLLIKPMAVLYTIFKNEADKTVGYLGLAKAAEYKELLGSEYDTAVDSILSNWFVTRGVGEAASGVVRVFFSRPPTSIYIGADTTFNINGVVFLPAEFKLYSAEALDFTSVINTVRNSVEYYIDVPVISSKYANITVTNSTPITGTVNSLYYLRAEVASAFLAGRDPETSAEFINRTQQVITTRELISESAIKTVLQDTLPGINYVYVAGFGAEEQGRDLVLVDNVYIHIGNKIDVYIQSNLIKKTLDIVGDTATEIDFARIISVIDTDTEEEVPISDYTIVDNIITVTDHDNTTVTYLYSPYLALARGLFVNAVACCDIQVRYMVVMPLTINITVHERLLDIDTATVKHYIVEYINTLPTSFDYSMTGMINYIKTQYPNIYDIDLPVDIKYGDLTYQMEWAGNNVQLYTDESYITVTVE